MTTKSALALAAFLGALGGFAFDHHLADEARNAGLPALTEQGRGEADFRSARQEERAPQ